MKVLIAGPYNSGGSRLLECIRMVCKLCAMPITYGSYVKFNTKKANEFEGMYIIKCNELHEMYFNAHFFDYVFVPCRDVRYYCPSDTEAIQNIALFRSLKTQATKIVRYEDFNVQQLVAVFLVMNMLLQKEVVEYMDHFVQTRYTNKNTKVVLHTENNEAIRSFLCENNYTYVTPIRSL